MPAPSDAAPQRIAYASAPASVGNVGVGFDLLGHSVAGAGDRARVRRIDAPEIRIAGITGCVRDLPTDPRQNTAGVALESLRAALGLDHGFELVLEKGIALGSGMGGSAASCVAALVAANALLDTPLTPEALYPCALDGEAIASGSRHGDNIGSMLLGGLVLATPTRLVRGCERGDAELVREGLKDVLIEPRRAPLIPGFARVKQAALDHGAMGASISGAGPSVFGWYERRDAAAAATAAMQAAFAEAGLESEAWVSPIAGPAAQLVEPWNTGAAA